MNIKIILGSTRQKRFGEYPAKWIFDKLKEREGIQAEILDLRGYKLPFFDEPVSPKNFKGNYPTKEIAKWAEKIKEADGFIIVSPEYNHGYPAVLKNALDHLYDEWEGRPVGFVSYGGVGGARAVEQLRQVVIELQMAPIRNSVHITNPWELLDENGELKSGVFDGIEGMADNFLDQLISAVKMISSTKESKKT